MSKNTKQTEKPLPFRFYKPGEKVNPFEKSTDPNRFFFWNEEYYFSTDPSRVVKFFARADLERLPAPVTSVRATLPEIELWVACMLHFLIMTELVPETRKLVDWGKYISLSRD